MKKILLALAMIVAVPTFTGGAIAVEDEKDTRDGFIGIRVHKNASMNFDISILDVPIGTAKDAPIGFGINLGSRLGKYVKWDYELGFVNGKFEDMGMYNRYTIFSGMLSFYGGYQFENGFEPYAGLGLGASLLTASFDLGYADISGLTLGLSYQAAVGVAYAINDRFGLDFGFKYINYGNISQNYNLVPYISADIYATEFYVGAVYKY